MIKFEKIRNEFPATKNQVYLDTPTTGLISNDSYTKMRSELDRRHFTGMKISEYWEEWDKCDTLRGPFSKMINCSSSEIFWGQNSSGMLSIIIGGMSVPEGAKILIPDISFPSTRNIWLNYPQNKDLVHYIKNTNGVVTTDEIIESIDEKTFAISICSVEHTSGYRYDLERIGKICREKNIYFIVDATQGLGAMEIDVERFGIDALVSSTYKWMTNTFGIGVGYIRKSLLDSLSTNTFGWVGIRDRIKDSSNLSLTINEGAKRFETGGLNWIGMSGLISSIETYLTLGKSDIEIHIQNLVTLLYEQLEDIKDIEISPKLDTINRSGIVYINISGDFNIKEEDFIKNNIRVNLYNNRIRIGIHYYNNKEDILALSKFLGKLKKN